MQTSLIIPMFVPTTKKTKSCPSIWFLSSGLSVGHIIIEPLLEGFVPA